MARPGRSSRADAISNSPYVRALIKPIYTIIPSPAPLPTPAPRDLISTQPTHPTAGASTWSVPKLAPPANAGEKKRKRSTSPPAAHDVAAVSAVVAGKQREREVQVNYTADNLPPELNKCNLPLFFVVASFAHSTRRRLVPTPSPLLPLRRGLSDGPRRLVLCHSRTRRRPNR